MSIPGCSCKSLLTFLHLLEFLGNLPSWSYMHLPSARVLHPMLFSLKAHHHTPHIWMKLHARWPRKRADFQLITILVIECRKFFCEATPVPSFSLSQLPSWAVFLCMAHRQDEALCTASTCIGNLKSDNLQIGKVMGKKHMSDLIMWWHVVSRVYKDEKSLLVCVCACVCVIGSLNRRLMEQ